MPVPTFYLSKDKEYLMDEHDRHIYALVHDNGRLYYKAIGIESEAVEEVCVNISTIKVCSLWSEAHDCLEFAQVDICTQLKLIPKGYSNIS